MARKLNPDQLPLITPDSDWEVPTELPDLSRVGLVAIDTETRDLGLETGRGPGWVYRSGHVAGFSVAWFAGNDVRSIYVPLRHPDTSNFDPVVARKWLAHVFAKNSVTFCNVGYDLGWIQSDLGIPPPAHAQIHDIGCMAMMIDENRRGERGRAGAYSLDAIAAWCGVEGKDEAALREAAVTYGYRNAKEAISRMPARYTGPYAEQDAVATLMSHRVLAPRIDQEDMGAAYRIEMELVPMILAMRQRGIRIDMDHCERACEELNARRDRALAELGDHLKHRVGMDEIRSHNWLVKTFSMLRVPFEQKAGKASFGKEWMRAADHWLPRLIAEAKQCHEASSKFVQGYLLDFAHMGRVHASINQYMTEEGGTRSHRFSYADPPLQQMPSRADPVDGWTLTEDVAKIIRNAFLPEEGEYWLACDYSQQEYRLIVHFADLLNCDKADEAVRKYNSDPKTDFHNLVVEMTGLVRRRAKDVNFAKAYGAGIPKFAAMTGMTLEEAEQVMGQYDTEMPFVKQLGQKCSKAADQRGFIKLLDGARSHFDDWEVAWLRKSERDRGWRDGWPMGECRIEEARRRVRGETERPWKAPYDDKHPWFGLRLKRAFTHKAMNRLIQGSAARQTKKAMVLCWREGLLPLIQLHDELGFSLSNEKIGKRVGEIMREAVRLRVPMRVDEEWGRTWGTAKLTFQEAVRS